jgi:hypothetical protein
MVHSTFARGVAVHVDAGDPGGCLGAAWRAVGRVVEVDEGASAAEDAELLLPAGDVVADDAELAERPSLKSPRVAIWRRPAGVSGASRRIWKPSMPGDCPGGLSPRSNAISDVCLALATPPTAGL